MKSVTILLVILFTNMQKYNYNYYHYYRKALERYFYHVEFIKVIQYQQFLQSQIYKTTDTPKLSFLFTKMSVLLNDTKNQLIA